ncbi:hypothetical protein KIPB_006974 [Kipferlia bialata]|uniref:Uncharacterized protein n=1 Tax=Kipferlia bialata TaxID=797122 RepID=A0A9K3CZD2_9EUKA|nr:hypothetical protein KIPB_006974 [Kipferlia bialata]|eukprot:g6974.t1
MNDPETPLRILADVSACPSLNGSADNSPESARERERKKGQEGPVIEAPAVEESPPNASLELLGAVVASLRASAPPSPTDEDATLPHFSRHSMGSLVVKALLGASSVLGERERERGGMSYRTAVKRRLPRDLWYPVYPASYPGLPYPPPSLAPVQGAPPTSGEGTPPLPSTGELWHLLHQPKALFFAACELEPAEGYREGMEGASRGFEKPIETPPKIGKGRGGSALFDSTGAPIVDSRLLFPPPPRRPPPPVVIPPDTLLGGEPILVRSGDRLVCAVQGDGGTAQHLDGRDAPAALFRDARNVRYSRRGYIHRVSEAVGSRVETACALSGHEAWTGAQRHTGGGGEGVKVEGGASTPAGDQTPVPVTASGGADGDVTMGTPRDTPAPTPPAAGVAASLPPHPDTDPLRVALLSALSQVSLASQAMARSQRQTGLSGEGVDRERERERGESDREDTDPPLPNPALRASEERAPKPPLARGHKRSRSGI